VPNYGYPIPDKQQLLSYLYENGDTVPAGITLAISRSATCLTLDPLPAGPDHH
jgi:hypothetical protein